MKVQILEPGVGALMQEHCSYVEVEHSVFYLYKDGEQDWFAAVTLKPGQILAKTHESTT